MFDSADLEVLDRRQCVELIGTVALGRIVYTDRAMPAVQAVPFVLDDRGIVLRASAGGKLSAAARNAVVAFEVDSVAEDLSSGWSVSVVGNAVEVTTAAELATLTRLPLLTWTPRPSDHFIRISVDLVTGRRIRPPGSGTGRCAEGATDPPARPGCSDTTTRSGG
jgi:nitroimidazol reductase NimA-like FMN-containing flavoprotein (pyridoxamine 5'-phosphate oxidase superfamily)